MLGVLEFLGFLLFVVFLIALAKPNRILRWSENPTRIEVFGYGALAFLIIISAYSVLKDKGNDSYSPAVSDGSSRSVKMAKPDVQFLISNNKVDESHLKTQISFDVLIEDKDIGEGKIRKLLEYFYDSTITRSGFTHHEHPTNVYIYAYTSAEKLSSGMGQWVGMVAKDHNDSIPYIQISAVQLRALDEVKEKKGELTYQQRQKVWNQIVRAEDKAYVEADKRYPTDLKKNMLIMEKLQNQYEKEIASSFNIDMAVIASIRVEGVEQGWPFPDLD